MATPNNTPNIQYTDDQLQTLATMHKQYPNMFSIKEKEYLNNVFISKGTTLDKASDESSLLGIANQFASGVVEGFTTLGWADEPVGEAEGIAGSIGHLIGFAPGILAGPAALAGKGALKIAAKKGSSKLAKAGIGLVGDGQSVGGAAKMFQGLNKYSIPMMAGDKAVEVLGKLAKGNAAIEGMAFMQQGKFAREALRHAVHLGTASAVSSWQEGVDGAMASFLHGAGAGAAFAGIGTFIDVRKFLNSKDARHVATMNKRVRGLAGSLFMGLPATLQGETTATQVYQYLLGAYFGAHTIPTFMEKANKFYSGLKPEEKWRPEKKEGFDKLSKDTQFEVTRMATEEVGRMSSMGSKEAEFIIYKGIEQAAKEAKTPEDFIKWKNDLISTTVEAVPDGYRPIEKGEIIRPEDGEQWIHPETGIAYTKKPFLETSVDLTPREGEKIDAKTGEVIDSKLQDVEIPTVEVKKEPESKEVVEPEHRDIEIPPVEAYEGGKSPEFKDIEVPAPKGEERPLESKLEPEVKEKVEAPINPETGKPFDKNVLKGNIDGIVFTTDPEAVAKRLTLDELYSIKDRTGLKEEHKKIYNDEFETRIAHLEKKNVLDEPKAKVKEEKAMGGDISTEPLKPTSTTKSGVTLYEKAFSHLSNQYDKIATKIKDSSTIVGKKKGDKLWGKYAAWYGDVDYTYTGVTHVSQKMPKEFAEMARQIEKQLGVKEGYFNSALANVFPKGTRLGAHADNEPIFIRKDKTIGKVATISLGGSTKIILSNNKTKKIESISVKDGSLYVMPGQKFQIENRHAVGPVSKDRISITFRHIPKSRLSEKTVEKKPLSQSATQPEEAPVFRDIEIKGVEPTSKNGEMSRESLLAESEVKRTIEANIEDGEVGSTIVKPIIEEIARDIQGKETADAKQKSLFNKVKEYADKGDGQSFSELLVDIKKSTGKTLGYEQERSLRRYYNNSKVVTSAEYIVDSSGQLVKKGDIKIDGSYSMSARFPSFLDDVAQRTTGKPLRIVTDYEQIKTTDTTVKDGIPSQKTEVFEKKIMEKPLEQFVNDLADINAQMEKDGYYYFGGKKDSDKLIFAPKLFESRTEVDAYLADKLDKVSSEQMKTRIDDLKKKESVLKSRISVDVKKLSLNPNDSKLQKKVKDAKRNIELNRQIAENLPSEVASNIRYYEESNGGMPLEEMLAHNKAGTGDFIANVYAYNKRLQVLNTVNDKPLSPFIIGKETLNTVIVNAIPKEIKNKYGITLDTYSKKEGNKTLDTDIHLDGIAIVSPAEFDNILYDGGHLKGAGIAKGVLKSANREQGMILGKYAYFRAESLEAKEMAKNNINVKIYDTSAKQKGVRKSMDWDMQNNEMVYFDGKNKSAPIIYEIPTRDFTVNTGTSENLAMMKGRQSLKRQFLWNPNVAQMGKENYRLVKEYFENSVRESVEGRETHNQLLRDYLGGKEKIVETDPKTGKEKVLEVKDLIDFEYVALNELVDIAVGSKQRHPVLYEKVWRHIRKSYEDFKDIAEDGKAYEMFLKEVYETSDVNETLLALGGYKPHTVMHKLNHRTNMVQLSQYIQNRILKPKVDFSGYSIGAPFTPYMAAKGLKLEKGKYFLGQDARKKIIRIRDVNNPEYYKQVTFEGAVKLAHDLMSNKDPKGRVERVKKAKMVEEDMRLAVMRTPSSSISGTRILRFGGFIDQPGYQIVMHPYDMTYLGGMDLDIDSVTWYQGLPSKTKDAFLSTQKEWETSDGYLLMPKEKIDTKKFSVPQPEYFNSTLAMFDPMVRAQVSHGASSTKNKLGWVNNRRYVMNAMIDAMTEGGGEFSYPVYTEGTQFGTIRFKRRKDSNKARELLDDLGHLAADSADGIILKDYRSSNPSKNLLLDIYNTVFKEINLEFTNGKSVKLLRNANIDAQGFKTLKKWLRGTPIGFHNRLLRVFGGRDFDNNTRYNLFDMIDAGRSVENMYPTESIQMRQAKEYGSIEPQLDPRKTVNAKNYINAVDRAIKDIEVLKSVGMDGIARSIQLRLKRIRNTKGFDGQLRLMANSDTHSKQYKHYTNALDMMHNDLHMVVNTAEIADYVGKLRKKGFSRAEIEKVANAAEKSIQKIHRLFLEGREAAVEKRQFKIKYEELDAYLNDRVKVADQLKPELRLLFEKALMHSYFPASSVKGGSNIKLRSYMFRRKDLVTHETLKSYLNRLNKVIETPPAELPQSVEPGNPPVMQDVSIPTEQVPTQTVKEKNVAKLNKAKAKEKAPKFESVEVPDNNLRNALFPDNPENKPNGIKTKEDAHKVLAESQTPLNNKELAGQYVKIVIGKMKKPNETFKRILKDDTLELSTEGKKLAERLNALFQWKPELINEIEAAFRGSTVEYAHGVPIFAKGIDMATMVDLRRFIEAKESQRMGKPVNVNILDFMHFPETVAEKLKKAGDANDYIKYSMKVLTRDGVITDDVKVSMSHFGRLQKSANLFIDDYANNVTNELQREVAEVFKDILKLPQGDDFLKIAISRYERNNGDGKKGERWHLYKKNFEKWDKVYQEKYKDKTFPMHGKQGTNVVPAEKIIDATIKSWGKFHKDFHHKWVNPIERFKKDGTIVFKDSVAEFRFKDDALKDEWTSALRKKDGQSAVNHIDINKAIPKILKSFETGKPMDIPLQGLHDIGFELALSMKRVKYGNSMMPLYEVLKLDKKTYARKMSLLKKRFWEFRPRTYYVENYFPHAGHPKKIVERFKAAMSKEMAASGASEADIALRMLKIDTKVGMDAQEDGYVSNPYMNMIMDANTKKGVTVTRLEEMGFKETPNWESIGSKQRPAASLSRSEQGPMPGWDISMNTVDGYVSQIMKARGNILFSLSAIQNIRHFSNKNTMGKYTDNWATFMKLFSRGVTGYPSIIPKEYHEKPDFPTKNNPFVWLSDQAMAKKMNKIADKYFDGKKSWKSDEELYRSIMHFSNLEAKYELMSLLAHSKSAVTNIYGGSMNTIISAGFSPWLKAQNFKWIQDNMPPGMNQDGKFGPFRSKADLEAWAETHGATESFITEMVRKTPVFRTARMRNFADEVVKALKKDPEMKDYTLMEIAKKHNVSKAILDGAAFFMRRAERKLRRDAFVAHYIQGMKVLEAKGVNFRRDDPWLIDLAKSGVKATQFLYSNANRPMFSATNLGRVYSRFQLFAWNSVRFRNQLRKMAAREGWNPNTKEMKRFSRMVTADMIAFALAQAFAMSLFDAAMPPPYQWVQDSATLLFGDEKSRDRAFFGTLPGPLAPIQAISPPGARLLLHPIGNLLKDDWSDFSSYQAWTWFPFGRMSRDVIKMMDNPVMAIERTTGIPLHGIQRYAKKAQEENEERRLKEAA